jgi:hypothetical protein
MTFTDEKQAVHGEIEMQHVSPFVNGLLNVEDTASAAVDLKTRSPHVLGPEDVTPCLCWSSSSRFAPHADCNRHSGNERHRPHARA